MTYSTEGLRAAEIARDEAIARLEQSMRDREAQLKEIQSRLDVQAEQQKKLEDQKEVQRLARAGFTGKDAKQKASAAKAESDFRAKLADTAKQYEQRISTSPLGGVLTGKDAKTSQKEYQEFRADQKKPKNERQYDAQGRKILSADDKKELQMIKDFQSLSNQATIRDSSAPFSFTGSRIFGATTPQSVMSILDFEKKYGPSPVINAATQPTTPVPEGTPAAAPSSIKFASSTPIQLNAPAGQTGMSYDDLLNKLKEYKTDKYARSARQIPANARFVGAGRRSY